MSGSARSSPPCLLPPPLAGDGALNAPPKMEVEEHAAEEESCDYARCVSSTSDCLRPHVSFTHAHAAPPMPPMGHDARAPSRLPDP